ncbi:hypothetical protein KUCAC02_023185 [Chaenocephalus aceratus]|uniref:Uncharacterized protein n=1 Tax=Chaenocephalus aceratus TaxID=36190 RepID=A0ACB9XQ77_CHAAC|nr:hypothetical protein KUCAC02_023185 [Chaenocephalus aceratus]
MLETGQADPHLDLSFCISLAHSSDSLQAFFSSLLLLQAPALLKHNMDIVSALFPLGCQRKLPVDPSVEPSGLEPCRRTHERSFLQHKPHNMQRLTFTASDSEFELMAVRTLLLKTC